MQNIDYDFEIKRLIQLIYSPTQKEGYAVRRRSTAQVYLVLTGVLPKEYLSLEDVFVAMQELGFEIDYHQENEREKTEWVVFMKL